MYRMEDIGSYWKNEEYLEEMTGVCQGECLFIMPSALQIEMDGVEQRLMGIATGSHHVVFSMN